MQFVLITSKGECKYFRPYLLSAIFLYAQTDSTKNLTNIDKWKPCSKTEFLQAIFVECKVYHYCEMQIIGKNINKSILSPENKHIRRLLVYLTLNHYKLLHLLFIIYILYIYILSSWATFWSTQVNSCVKSISSLSIYKSIFIFERTSSDDVCSCS